MDVEGELDRAATDGSNPNFAKLSLKTQETSDQNMIQCKMYRYVFKVIFVLGVVFPCLFNLCDAYQVTWRPAALLRCPKVSTSIGHLSRRNIALTSHQFAVASEENEDGDGVSNPTIREKLRKATGFSLTAFRSTWRAATGISLSAIYASALAASGLWIRNVMSVILSIFPAWFRYFLQPFLVFYYAPLFILRGLTGPTRKRAKAKHELVLDGWKDAVEFAEKTTKDGYRPLHINEDGEFELVKPPKPDESKSEQLADAVAESVEQAMEEKFINKEN